MRIQLLLWVFNLRGKFKEHLNFGMEDGGTREGSPLWLARIKGRGMKQDFTGHEFRLMLPKFKKDHLWIS
jgi:hypothetical protein